MMQKKWTYGGLLALTVILLKADCALCGQSDCDGAVNLESLLDEMTDRDAVTYVDAAPYRMKLFSSHDRRSTSPDSPGWFANDDYSQFVRVETNRTGRVERVLMDDPGPGAIVRFWETVCNVKDGAYLRVYVDGELVIEGKGFDVLSGGAVCGAPLSDSVSRQTPVEMRGHNLYLPIPYAGRCKVTAEYPEGKGEMFFYNIEARKYPAGTPVESLTKAVLSRARARIAAANETLAGNAPDSLPPGCEVLAEKGVELKPGGTWSREFTGPGALREIAFTVDASVGDGSLPPLRDLLIRLEFDGERTVDVPAVMFVGAGVSPCAFDTRFTSDAARGCEHAFTARWVMPFRRSAKVTFINGSELLGRLERVSVVKGAYAWDEARSMRFHVKCNDYRQIRTRDGGSHRDLSYLRVDGRPGKFIGCGVSIMNAERVWWGEGDEKVFVDGERIPSYVGTGTEDHFGYAWCRPEAFSHPFVAQPDGAGNLAPGHSANLRHRVLDAIPFTKSLQYDMELWHWKDCTVDYRTVSWYYLATNPTDGDDEPEKGGQLGFRQTDGCAQAADFNISDYGAKADGSKCSAAFEKAIGACAEAGGGRVVVPAGRWLSGAIRLKSNVELHLSENAEILFSQEPDDYLPAVHTSWEGMECWNYCPLVYAYCCTNVAITGKGTLRAFDGEWEKTRWYPWVPQENGVKAARLQLYTWGATDYPVEKREIWKMKNANTRPHFVQFNRCKDVRLQGFRIRNSPFWTLHLYMCDGATVEGLDVYAHGDNNDGIDIEMSRNVLVENCTFDQGDDGVVIKSGRNQDAWRLHTPTENVLIRNCHVKDAHTVLGIGSEISGGVRNVRLENCRAETPYRVFFLKTNRRRGGFLENIVCENVTCKEARESVFEIDMDVLYEWADFPDYKISLTRISDIAAKNISVGKTKDLFRFSGDARLQPCRIRAENVNCKMISGARCDIRNVDDFAER